MIYMQYLYSYFCCVSMHPDCNFNIIFPICSSIRNILQRCNGKVGLKVLYIYVVEKNAMWKIECHKKAGVLENRSMKDGSSWKFSFREKGLRCRIMFTNEKLENWCASKSISFIAKTFVYDRKFVLQK